MTATPTKLELSRRQPPPHHLERRPGPRVRGPRAARQVPLRHVPRETQRTAAIALAAADHLGRRNPTAANHGDEARRQLRLFDRLQRRPQHGHLHARIAARDGPRSHRVTASSPAWDSYMEWVNSLKEWGAANGPLLWWIFAVSLALIAAHAARRWVDHHQIADRIISPKNDVAACSRSSNIRSFAHWLRSPRTCSASCCSWLG